MALDCIICALALRTVQSLTQTTKSLTQILFITFVVAVSVHAAIVNSSLEAVSDITRRGGPVATLVGDVVLHAGIRIDCKLHLLDRSTKTLVVLSCIDIVSIIFRVVNMLLKVGSVELCGRLVQHQLTSGR